MPLPIRQFYPNGELQYFFKVIPIVQLYTS
jgi:hypothetical protein